MIEHQLAKNGLCSEPIRAKDTIGYLIPSDPEELKAIVAKIKKCISKSKERKIQAKPLKYSKKKEKKSFKVIQVNT